MYVSWCYSLSMPVSRTVNTERLESYDLFQLGNCGRYLTLGFSVHNRLIVVIHKDRTEAIRLISARPATPKERRNYEQRQND